MPVLEISDLIVHHDPRTGVRQPVRRDAVVDALRAAGDRRGARIAASLPHRDGVLDADAVDRLLVRAHTELQRLNEELRLPEELAFFVRPLLDAVRQEQVGRPRVIDVGCGIGYAVRWLAATRALGDAELYGVDFNPALVAEANRLAAAEGLDCRFVHGNAFDPDRLSFSTAGLADARSSRSPAYRKATVFVSIGVLHHLRGDELGAFFRAQAAAGAQAYCHLDAAATRLGPLGSWIFHRARMREPLGRHDGVASARRAHPDGTLLAAAGSAPELVGLLYRPLHHSLPFCPSLRPLLGVRAKYLPALQGAFGPGARHIVAQTRPRQRPW